MVLPLPTYCLWHRILSVLGISRVRCGLSIFRNPKSSLVQVFTCHPLKSPKILAPPLRPRVSPTCCHGGELSRFDPGCCRLHPTRVPPRPAALPGHRRAGDGAGGAGPLSPAAPGAGPARRTAPSKWAERRSDQPSVCNSRASPPPLQCSAPPSA